MTSEIPKPRKPEYSLNEVNRQNRESYRYLRLIVNEDETPLIIDEGTTVCLKKRGKPYNQRFDQIHVVFNSPEGQINSETYVFDIEGLLGFYLNSVPIALSSGLQTEIREHRIPDSGYGLLKEEDRGVRTPTKVIADGIRLRLRLAEA